MRGGWAGIDQPQGLYPEGHSGASYRVGPAASGQVPFRVRAQGHAASRRHQDEETPSGVPYAPPLVNPLQPAPDWYDPAQTPILGPWSPAHSCPLHPPFLRSTRPGPLDPCRTSRREHPVATGSHRVWDNWFDSWMAFWSTQWDKLGRGAPTLPKSTLSIAGGGCWVLLRKPLHFSDSGRGALCF